MCLKNESVADNVKMTLALNVKEVWGGETGSWLNTMLIRTQLICCVKRGKEKKKKRLLSEAL